VLRYLMGINLTSIFPSFRFMPMSSPSTSLFDLLTEGIRDIKLYQTASVLDGFKPPPAIDEVSPAPMNF